VRRWASVPGVNPLLRLLLGSGRLPDQTLVHELAHALGLGYRDLGRQRAEARVCAR
jgi:hypothetical protein